eukprot:1446593-Amphidinium_carterae.1
MDHHRWMKFRTACGASVTQSLLPVVFALLSQIINNGWFNAEGEEASSRFENAGSPTDLLWG